MNLHEVKQAASGFWAIGSKCNGSHNERHMIHAITSAGSHHGCFRPELMDPFYCECYVCERTYARETGARHYISTEQRAEDRQSCPPCYLGNHPTPPTSL